MQFLSAGTVKGGLRLSMAYRSRPPPPAGSGLQALENYTNQRETQM
jgi:hypothetical protein